MINKQIAENLYRKLLDEGEQETLDAKEMLEISTDGDKAFLIHHVVGFANNKTLSYILIGIKNITWELVGIPPLSDWLNADLTERRLNAVLAPRTDPVITVKYGVYDLRGQKIGLISVIGTDTPYTVSLKNQVEFGGNRTKAAPFFIREGGIYVRRGSSTVIASRSEIIKIANNKDNPPSENLAQQFLVDSNLLDVDSKDFGINERIIGLFEYISDNYQPVTSWVSIVITPLSNEKLPTHTVKEFARNYTRQNSHNWLEFLPYELNEALKSASINPRRIIGSFGFQKEYDTHRFYMNDQGIIEILVTEPLIFERDGIRAVDWVFLDGYIWQISHFVNELYKFANLGFKYNIVISLINIKGTKLSSHVPKPQEIPYSFKHRMKWSPACEEQNIQITANYNNANSSEDLEKIIRIVSHEIGQYYEQDKDAVFVENGGFPERHYFNNTQHQM